MGIREKLSEAKEAASDAVAETRDAVSERSGRGRETVARATDAASKATDAVSERARGAKDHVAARLGDEDVTAPVVRALPDRETARSLATTSYERFSAAGAKLEPVAERYGVQAAEVADDVDFAETYRLGKTGLKYGKEYGDYVPVGGGFVPWVGFAAGVGVGVLDGTDVISAEDVAQLSSVVESAGPVGDDASDALAPGSDPLADVSAGEATEADVEAVLRMDYDEFAGR